MEIKNCRKELIFPRSTRGKVVKCFIVRLSRTPLLTLLILGNLSAVVLIWAMKGERTLYRIKKKKKKKKKDTVWSGN